jgi:peptidoglycan hydrolase CwlO-like protein
MMEHVAIWLTGSVGAVLALVGAWLRTPRGRASVLNFLLGTRRIDAQTSNAVSTSLDALQAALDARTKEHAHFMKEIEELRFEIAELRQADANKQRTIDSLRVQVVALQKENKILRALIEEAGS